MPVPAFRKLWILAASLLFHYRFAGPAGVIPIIFLGIITYLAALSKVRILCVLAIILCILELVFYKYATFILSQLLRFFDPEIANQILVSAKQGIIPEAAPLAISFFVFEFIHYLVDIHRGKQPIRSVTDFTLFSLFWPSIVSGPVKRFEQFLPSVVSGCKKTNFVDIKMGALQIIIGLIKKLVIADFLTGYITYWQPHYQSIPIGQRWLLVMAISFRILLDFSGYSDMAIGFARMMGIKLPANFNWPYLATSLQEFWHRWHISLSTWIRDYVYIPLGGSKNGSARKLVNGIIAFGACGLWHGAAWNFIFWGLYHGVGLAVSTNLKKFFFPRWSIPGMTLLVVPLKWFSTFMFVSIGWLYFFYPVEEANKMLVLLFKFSN